MGGEEDRVDFQVLGAFQDDVLMVGLVVRRGDVEGIGPGVEAFELRVEGGGAFLAEGDGGDGIVGIDFLHRDVDRGELELHGVGDDGEEAAGDADEADEEDDDEDARGAEGVVVEVGEFGDPVAEALEGALGVLVEVGAGEAAGGSSILPRRSAGRSR